MNTATTQRKQPGYDAAVLIAAACVDHGITLKALMKLSTQEQLALTATTGLNDVRLVAGLACIKLALHRQAVGLRDA